MSKVTIIYDTRSGHTKEMANSILEGVLSIEGIHGSLKYIDDATANDLVTSQGLIVGSPTHCGVMSWKIKKFFDENTKAAWGKVDGRIAAAFTSSGGLGGGNEMTLLSILSMLLNYGYLTFGLPEYSAPGVTAHYGAVAIGSPSNDVLKSCFILGQKTAKYVKAMNYTGL